MKRGTLLAVATASVTTLATGYLLWGRHQPMKQVPSEETTAPDALPPAAVPATTVVTKGDAALPLAAGGAVIEGEVQFAGTPPVPGKLHREADPYCARREMTDPTVLVASGKLANV